MQEQLIKMAAAAFGITPEATQQVISEVMSFVQTANARIGAIEVRVEQIYAMTKALHDDAGLSLDSELEQNNGGNIAPSSDTGGNAASN